MRITDVVVHGDRGYVAAGWMALALASGCSPDELSRPSAGQAEIDVCVAATSGAAPTCYEALKEARRDELCAGGDTCLRPTLSLDAGDIPSGLGDTVAILVRSVGELTLDVQPLQEDGGVDPFDVFQPIAPEAPIHLEPGEEHALELRLRGAPCGAHDSRVRVFSNDSEYDQTQLGRFDAATADSPVVIDVAAHVSGACVCPRVEGVLDFGEVPLGVPETRRWTLESCGDAPLTMTAAQIGEDASGYYAVSGTLFPGGGDVLLPGEQGHIDVTYTPYTVSAPGAVDAAKLWIETNSPTAQPHATVILTGRAVPRPQCTLAAVPFQVSFGTVSGSATRNVRVVNEGDASCRLLVAQRTWGSAAFNVTAGAIPPTVTLAPGVSHELGITFTPSGIEVEQATIEVSGEDLFGNYVSVPFLFSGNPDVPEDSTCWIEASPDFVDFGDLSVGQLAQMNVTLTNRADDIGFPPCSITSADITSGAPDFHGGETGLLASFFLPPGMSTTATVYFEPTSPGIKVGSLAVRSPGGDFDLPLFGNALGSALCVDVDGVEPATTVCTATQPCDTLHFGAVSPSANVVREVTLTNCGAGLLDVHGVGLDAASSPTFTLLEPTGAQLPFALAPGASRTVRLRYDPLVASGDFGALEVLSSAQPRLARINVRGNYDGACTRILRCDPSALDFGSQETGVADVRTTLCSNFGTDPVVVSNVTLSGDPELDLVSDTYATLAPGESLPVQVRCSPTAAGDLLATGEITSDACDASPLAFAVACHGLVPDLPPCIGASTFAPEEKWRWTGTSAHPGFDDVWITPVVLNMTDDNGDGRVDVLDSPEVIFTALPSALGMGQGTGGGDMDAFCRANDPVPAIVVAVRGEDGQELWTWGTPLSTSGEENTLAMDSEAGLAAGDLDGDGLPEIVGVKFTYVPPRSCEAGDFECCLMGKYVSGSLIALEHDGAFKWESERWHLPRLVGENAGTPAIGDLNGDGFPEIAFGNAVFDRHGRLLFEGETMEGSTGHGEGGAGHGAFSALADLDGNGSNDLVAGRTAFRHDGSVLWHRPNLADGLVTIANLDADPSPEIILFTGDNDLLILEHDGTTARGPLRIESGRVDDNGNPEGFITTNPAVGDVDGDGWPEIVIAATTQVIVLEHDLTQKWSAEVFDGTGMSGPTTFDFEGDGRDEVLYADETTVRMFDGLTGTVKYEADRSSRTIADNPVVADVDNDGHADILLAMETPLGPTGLHGLIAYSNTANNWVGTRRVWNQHSYHITNVTESGVIPAREGSGWLEHNVYRANVVRCE